MTKRTTDRKRDAESKNVSSRAKKLATTARRGTIDSRVWIKPKASISMDETTSEDHGYTVNFCPEGEAAISLTVGKSIAPPTISKWLSGLAARCRLRISMAIYAPTECPIRMTLRLGSRSTLDSPMALSCIRVASFSWTKQIWPSRSRSMPLFGADDSCSSTAKPPREHPYIWNDGGFDDTSSFDSPRYRESRDRNGW